MNTFEDDKLRVKGNAVQALTVFPACRNVGNMRAMTGTARTVRFRNIGGVSDIGVAVVKVDFPLEFWTVEIDACVQDCNLYALSSPALSVFFIGANQRQGIVFVEFFGLEKSGIVRTGAWIWAEARVWRR